MDETLAVFLPGSFYVISLLVALLGIYYVIRPSRLQDGLANGQMPVDEDTEAASK
ncbi:hypothetical protein [Mucilaginibacter antarcticus]